MAGGITACITGYIKSACCRVQRAGGGMPPCRVCIVHTHTHTHTQHTHTHTHVATQTSLGAQARCSFTHRPLPALRTPRMPRCASALGTRFRDSVLGGTRVLHTWGGTLSASGGAMDEDMLWFWTFSTGLRGCTKHTCSLGAHANPLSCQT
jgi:hypothetical protein